MPVPENTPPQTLTSRGISSLLDLAEKQVTTGLREFAEAASDLPGFLAGPTPQSPSALPLYGITRAACRTYARGGGPQNLPGFDSVWGGICDPYLDSIGENPAPGSLAPPFQGGQCSGVNYFGEFSFTDSQGTRQTAGWLLGGPILGLFTRPGANGSTESGIRATFSNGTPDDRILATTPAGTIPAPSFVIQGIQGGVPDNCGNPPFDYNPPEIVGGLPPLPSQPISFPGIGPVDVDVTFGPDGEIIIDFPGIGGDVTIANPFDPDGGGGGEAPVTPPGFQGAAGDAIDVGPGDAADETDPNRNLLGVLVQTIAFPPRVNRLFNPTESYTKGAYYVYLGGDAGLSLIDTAAITRVDQFYPAPPGSNRFRVVPNAGFTLRITPFYEDN